MIGWLVAAVFAVLSVYLAFRRPRPPESVPVGSADTGSGKEPGARQDASEKALQGMSRYLKAAVLRASRPETFGLQWRTQWTRCGTSPSTRALCRRG